MKKTSFAAFAFFSACCFTTSLSAAEFSDTIRVASVQIEGRIQFGMNYIGSHVQSLDAGLIEINPTANMAELLSANTQLNIKKTGNSGVSTAMFRGASSSQTQTNWNGISITPSTQGNFDFSQTPAFFIDQVLILPGGGNAKSGLGALGGTIDMVNKPYFSEPSIMVTSEYGSYGTWSTGYKARVGNGRTSATTRVLYQQSDNDYFYPDPLLPKQVRRDMAGYNSVGAMQDLFHVLRKGGMISASVWYQRSDNDLPSSVAYPSDAVSKQLTSNLRSMVGYNRSYGASDYRFTLAYIRDMTDYSSVSASWGDTYAKTIGSSYVAKFDYALKAGTDLDFGATLNYRHENVLSDNFEDKTAHLNSASVQLHSMWHPGERFTARLRYSPVVNDEDFVHTYAVGVGFDIVPGWLSIGATNSYNKRFPAMNDIYFAGSANPDLKPERGFSTDGTITFTPVTGNLKMKFDATYFNLNIVDWIEWAPESAGSWVWIPQNVKHVLSRGVELSLETSLAVGKTKNKVNFNYTHTSTTDQNNDDMQLQYVPFNKWNARYTFETGQFYAAYNMNHIGNTYDESRMVMERYTIHDIQAGYTFVVGSGTNMKISGRISNLFNTCYQSTAGYPMPLRMGHIGLSFMM